MINNQNKSKVFLVIIGILLITNIGMLVFFLQKKAPEKSLSNRPDRKAYISNILKNEIGFNQDQLTKYDTLSKRHRDKIYRVFDSARNKKNIQFRELVAGNFTDSVINRLAQESAESQKRMEVSMLNHIRNIRLLCSPEQLPKFDTSFGKVFNRRGGGNVEGRKKTTK